MIFDNSTGQFIDDGRTDRLRIHGFAMISSKQMQPAAFGRLGNNLDVDPEEASFNVIENVEFVFADGVLKIYSGNRQLLDLQEMLFIMSESEGTLAQSQSGMNGNDAYKALSPQIKTALQSAIDQIALANQVSIPANIDFFNDKLLLYMFPLLRTLANSSTNYYKILNDLKSSDKTEYYLTHNLLEQKNINDAVKVYLGTSSKLLIKFIADRIIKKTDLVKSLSPELLQILINHSGKIFGAIGQEKPEVKVLTCYEDVELDLFPKMRYLLDVFNNNIDHLQTLLSYDIDLSKIGVNKKRGEFLRNNFTPKKIFTIFKDAEGYSSYLNDLVNQFNTYKDPDTIPPKLKVQYPNGLELPKNWKTLKELHDKVSIDFNKIKAEDNNKTIPYTEVEFQLHGLKKDNVELMLPSEASVLVAWGSEQHHCVASYADRAARKELLIVGVKINNKHLYTMEVRTKPHVKDYEPNKIYYTYVINQFHGERNQSPESLGDLTIKKTVRELLDTVFTGNSRFMDNKMDVSDNMDALMYALGDREDGAARFVPPHAEPVDLPPADNAEGNFRNRIMP